MGLKYKSQLEKGKENTNQIHKWKLKKVLVKLRKSNSNIMKIKDIQVEKQIQTANTNSSRAWN